jgi:ABC-type transport system involved in cytochrome c biogenesis permease component
VVFAAIASVFALAVQFRRDERWRPMSRPSLISGVVALASLVATLAGGGNLFFYIFLVVLLAWLSLVAAHALRLARSPAP